MDVCVFAQVEFCGAQRFHVSQGVHESVKRYAFALVPVIAIGTVPVSAMHRAARARYTIIAIYKYANRETIKKNRGRVHAVSPSLPLPVCCVSVQCGTVFNG